MKTTITITNTKNENLANIWPVISRMFQWKPVGFDLLLQSTSFNNSVTLIATYELDKIWFLIKTLKDHKRRLRNYSMQIHNKDELVKDVEYYKTKIADYFNIPVEMIDKNTRKREIVIARQVSIFFVKHKLKKSHQFIGDNYRGGMNHASITYSLQTINNLIETDKKFAEQMRKIEREL